MNSGTYQGSWNGLAAGYCPPGYSAFERWCAGWIEPIELAEPTQIDHLKPLGGTPMDAWDGGDAYVVYCRGNTVKGEYYLLENRQNVNWDECLPWRGLLISHYDFDASAWSSNKPNSTDHERAGIIQASGTDLNRRLEMDAYPFDPADLLEKFAGKDYGSTPEDIMATLYDLYGTTNLNINTERNDALTVDTSPVATYYNGGNTEQAFADHEITKIAHNGDSELTMRFTYRNYQPEMQKCATPVLEWSNGRVNCTCETEGVAYKYSMTMETDGENTDGRIALSGTVHFSVWGTRPDLQDSDVATLDVPIPQVGDVNGDGQISIADVTALVNIILGKEPL